jgi:NAD-dependent deacetylase
MTSALTKTRNLVILTGAGISAESGIQTFRASDGLWEEHRIEDVATPQGFRANPDLVHKFYNQRRSKLSSVEPNAAHVALAQLEKEWMGAFLLVTQNVDDLHERAGSHQLLHMHGQLLKAFCEICEKRQDQKTDLSVSHACPSCRAQRMRPDIVWFGEMPYHMEAIEDALESADLFISIGTSGLVYPAAGFSHLATRARRIEVNLQGTSVSPSFNEHRLGLASVEVPRLVDELLHEN